MFGKVPLVNNVKYLSILIFNSSMEKLCLKVFLFVGLFLHFVKDMPYALSDKEARLSEVFSPGGDD